MSAFSKGGSFNERRDVGSDLQQGNTKRVITFSYCYNLPKVTELVITKPYRKQITLNPFEGEF